MSDSPLVPPTVIPPELDPLKQSHEANDVEADLKAAFIEVFEDMLRPVERRINSYGMPHRGDFQTVERFVKAEGLAMDRSTNGEAYMRELYRAWRAHNPRRGTAFMRHYLQLIYPASTSVSQLWMPPSGGSYPDDALPTPGGSGWFLTSRVRVTLDGSEITVSEAEFNLIQSVLLAVLPARMVLELYILAGGGFTSGPRMAAVPSTAELVKIDLAAAP